MEGRCENCGGGTFLGKEGSGECCGGGTFLGKEGKGGFCSGGAFLWMEGVVAPLFGNVLVFTLGGSDFGVDGRLSSGETPCLAYFVV